MSKRDLSPDSLEAQADALLAAAAGALFMLRKRA